MPRTNEAPECSECDETMTPLYIKRDGKMQKARGVFECEACEIVAREESSKKKGKGKRKVDTDDDEIEIEDDEETTETEIDLDSVKDELRSIKKNAGAVYTQAKELLETLA